jgi:hypothetical protein
MTARSANISLFTAIGSCRALSKSAGLRQMGLLVTGNLFKLRRGSTDILHEPASLGEKRGRAFLPGFKPTTACPKFPALVAQAASMA